MLGVRHGAHASAREATCESARECGRTLCTVGLTGSSQVEEADMPVSRGFLRGVIPEPHADFPAWVLVLALSVLRCSMLDNLLNFFGSLSTRKMEITPTFNRLLLVLNELLIHAKHKGGPYESEWPSLTWSEFILFPDS